MSDEPARKAPRREGGAGPSSAAARKAPTESLKDGPFALLDFAQRNNKQVFICCRNDKCLLGHIRAFDKHFNVLLQGVEEHDKLDESKQRRFNSLFVRGDSVIFIAPYMHDE